MSRSEVGYSSIWPGLIDYRMLCVGVWEGGFSAMMLVMLTRRKIQWDVSLTNLASELELWTYLKVPFLQRILADLKLSLQAILQSSRYVTSYDYGSGHRLSPSWEFNQLHRP